MNTGRLFWGVGILPKRGIYDGHLYGKRDVLSIFEHLKLRNFIKNKEKFHQVLGHT